MSVTDCCKLMLLLDDYASVLVIIQCSFSFREKAVLKQLMYITLTGLFFASEANARDLIEVFDSSKHAILSSEFGLSSRLEKDHEIGAEVTGNVQMGVFEGSELSIQLPSDVAVTVTKSTVKGSVDKANHQHWVGKAKGYENSSANFTVYNDILVGRMEIDDVVYEIRPTKKSSSELIPDSYQIKRIDIAALPSCETTGDEAAQLAENKSSEITKFDRQLPQANSTAGEVVIDLLSVYTPAARDSLGGVSAIEAFILAGMDIANTAFENSEMGIRFNMTHMALVDYTEVSSFFDLEWVRENEEVAGLRDVHHADMVSLISDGNYCGRGFVQRSPGADFADSAFQISDVDCAVSNLTFAHEHGHNMGMEHNPGDFFFDPSIASFEFAFGHSVSGSYRTIMSLSGECTSRCERRMFFSNPNVSVSSTPAGIAGERDNARVGRLTAPIIRDFRMAPEPPAPEELCVPIKASNDAIAVVCL